ncbi:Oidioi.mRNA.OKI2018_I69.XSR.g15853.t1.cds [Oikopleura dioica]|uniref:Oidioi.mRNA.OKI2018_I69.XSR.g15853.t1.cds n=1 Tax=Oikopleura dioica TaxID=34765 RepID=A0ABN7SE61_OIKDI|nr:Oidioi.mRNA.OKI2018_I69.XSR.g15853.t1.cds [Oikopleura dioica]
MSRLASLFIALASCSRLDLTMEISENSGDSSSVLTSFKLSGAEIRKLTRRERHKEGLRRGKRMYREPAKNESGNYDGICKPDRQSLNDNELKKFLCDHHFHSIKTFIKNAYFYSDAEKPDCEKNLMILKGTSREIPTRCKMETKRSFHTDNSCLSAGSSHCSTPEINRLCDHVAHFWERHVPTTNWGNFVVHPKESCKPSDSVKDVKDRMSQRASCCKRKMQSNPILNCKEIEIREDYHHNEEPGNTFTTKVEFVYIVKEHSTHSGTKKLFTIKIKSHGLCAATLV